METCITAELLAEIKSQYYLKWYGTHGVIHWSRVYENGMYLAQQEDVNNRIVQLFSVFHDACRKNEHNDRNHGKRGAELALKLRDFYSLDDEELLLLTTACSLHTSTLNHENITVQACFDSDRLDLGRVNNMPDSGLLCTETAKMDETIKWAYARSGVHELPKKPFGLSDTNVPIE